MFSLKLLGTKGIATRSKDAPGITTSNKKLLGAEADPFAVASPASVCRSGAHFASGGGSLPVGGSRDLRGTHHKQDDHSSTETSNTLVGERCRVGFSCGPWSCFYSLLLALEMAARIHQVFPFLIRFFPLQGTHFLVVGRAVCPGEANAGRRAVQDASQDGSAAGWDTLHNIDMLN